MDKGVIIRLFEGAHYWLCGSNHVKYGKGKGVPIDSIVRESADVMYSYAFAAEAASTGYR